MYPCEPFTSIRHSLSSGFSTSKNVINDFRFKNYLKMFYIKVTFVNSGNEVYLKGKSITLIVILVILLTFKCLYNNL